MMLTNKSTRVYDTSEGKFYPGTSKEFEDKEAIHLLGYTGEIVRTTDALGADAKKVIEKATAAKDKEIERLESFVSGLKAEIKNLKVRLKAPARGRPR